MGTLHFNKLQLAVKCSLHCWGNVTFLGQHLKEKQPLGICACNTESADGHPPFASLKTYSILINPYTH